MKKWFRFKYLLICCSLLMAGSSLVFGQAVTVKRNPVLEITTATWCPPCGSYGHKTAELVHKKHENAIILNYHPKSSLLGTTQTNNMFTPLDLGYMPTARAGRLPANNSNNYLGTGEWMSAVDVRSKVAPTVKIEALNKTYYASNKQLEIELRFTALVELSGKYRYHVILTEDHIRAEQTYIGGAKEIISHEGVVRQVMNGIIGTSISQGTWGRGQSFTGTLNEVIPTFDSQLAKDIVPDNCHIAVIVYKDNGKQLADAEIQQAEKWSLTGPLVATNPGSTPVVESFELRPNYPNPFNPQTHISYVLPVGQSNRHVSLVIYNQMGQKIRTLVNKTEGPGSHEVTWKGLDDQGNPVASGVYFYHLRSGKLQQTQKMLLMR